MKSKKNLKSFLREEDGKTIKKSLLIAWLWLVVWYWITNTASAWHRNVNSHSSATWWNYHTSTHANHNNHSSY